MYSNANILQPLSICMTAFNATIRMIDDSSFYRKFTAARSFPIQINKPDRTLIIRSSSDPTLTEQSTKHLRQSNGNLFTPHIPSDWSSTVFHHSKLYPSTDESVGPSKDDYKKHLNRTRRRN